MTDKTRSYSTTEVAQRLGISTQTVQRWVDTGQLKAWKTLGGHRRIEAEGVELLFRLHGLAQPDGTSPASTPASDAPAQALSILIVDDNPDDRDILAHLVSEAFPKATVAAATNGFHGLVALGRMAPHMNGFEMLRQLLVGCAVKPRYILAVSSNALEDLADKGHLPQGVAFMRKPLEPDDFIALLKQGVQAPKTPKTATQTA